MVPDAMGISSNWTPAALPLDVTRIDPGQEPWGQNLGESCSLIFTTTNCNNNVLGGGPYSTPHFRLSSSTAMGHALRRSPLSVSGSLTLPHSNVASPPESVATHVELIVPGRGETPEVTLDEYRFDEDFELEELAADESSTNAPTTVLLDRPNISPRNLPPSDSILNRRPLTLRDRIHKLGQEMRTSAATSFTKFPSPIPSPPGSPSVCTSFSQVLDSTLVQSLNHGNAVKVEDKSRGIGREAIVTMAAEAEEDAQIDLHYERLALQQQRQQRRFQSSVR